MHTQTQRYVSEHECVCLCVYVWYGGVMEPECRVQMAVEFITFVIFTDTIGKGIKHNISSAMCKTDWVL